MERDATDNFMQKQRNQPANGKNMPDAYRAAESMEQLLQAASRESVRRLMWQMEHGPTLVAKERAATMLAKIAVSRPPQRVELAGKDGGAVQTEHVIRFVEPEKRA